MARSSRSSPSELESKTKGSDNEFLFPTPRGSLLAEIVCDTCIPVISRCTHMYSLAGPSPVGHSLVGHSLVGHTHLWDTHLLDTHLEHSLVGHSLVSPVILTASRSCSPGSRRRLQNQVAGASTVCSACRGEADAAPLAGCSRAFRGGCGEGDAPGRLDQGEHRQVCPCQHERLPSGDFSYGPWGVRL